MPRTSGLFLFVLVALCAAAGCGTLYNNEFVPCPKNEPDVFRIYGGVRKDLEAVGSIATYQEPVSAPDVALTVAGGVAFLAIDVPLSTIGDTIFLPYTFWKMSEQMPTAEKTQK